LVFNYDHDKHLEKNGSFSWIVREKTNQNILSLNLDSENSQASFDDRKKNKNSVSDIDFSEENSDSE